MIERYIVIFIVVLLFVWILVSARNTKSCTGSCNQGRQPCDCTTKTVNTSLVTDDMRRAGVEALRDPFNIDRIEVLVENVWLDMTAVAPVAQEKPERVRVYEL